VEPKSAHCLKLEADNCEKTIGRAPIAAFLPWGKKTGMETQMGKAQSHPSD